MFPNHLKFLQISKNWQSYSKITFFENSKIKYFFFTSSEINANSQQIKWLFFDFFLSLIIRDRKSGRFFNFLGEKSKNRKKSFFWKFSSSHNFFNFSNFSKIWNDLERSRKVASFKIKIKLKKFLVFEILKK